MKNIIKLLLVGLLSISLIGCSSGDSNDTDDSSIGDTTSETETTNDETDVSDEETSEDDDETSIENLLCQDLDDEEKSSSSLRKCVFGNEELEREDIQTITFLDSLSDMPSDVVDSWDASENKDGSVMAWLIENGDLYDLYIAGNGGVNANPDSQYLFFNFKNVTSINFNNCFNTSYVTSMKYMFDNCTNLTSLDVSTFDTSNVQNMECMFAGMESITTLDVSNFNTSKVIDMTGMFGAMDSLVSLDLSSFDTSSVTMMASMFSSDKALISLNLSSFDTSRVTDMRYMFDSCESLYDLDISNFDISDNTKTTDMFYRCPAEH